MLVRLRLAMLQMSLTLTNALSGSWSISMTTSGFIDASKFQDADKTSLFSNAKVRVFQSLFRLLWS